MIVVYVAGPYTAPDAWAREHNIRQAEAFAFHLAREGFATICPHTMARHWHGAVDEPTAIAHGLALVERCDALVLVDPGAHLRSAGTRGEVVHARGIPIPCFALAVDLRVWARGGKAVGLDLNTAGEIVTAVLPAKARTA